jgi:AraC family transcriptional regulator of arabinose operon
VNVSTTTSDLPNIDRAGYFQIHNAVFEFSYRNPTNAIHLYDYAGRIRIGSREYSFSSGDITCIPGGTVYSIQSDANNKHWCIHYNEPLTDTANRCILPNHLHFGANSLFYREQIQLVSRLFNSPHNDNKLLQLEARLRLKALLLGLYNLNVAQSTRSRSRKNFSWTRLFAWIDDHLDQPLSVPQVAEQVNITASTLSKQFKQVHHTTLNQYLLHRRIDKAKSLLATTTLTIYEIGATVGIPDPQYFNKQFRKVAGLSPSRYRNENQEYLSNLSTDLATQGGRWQTDSE